MSVGSTLNAITFPDSEMRRRYTALVGLDDVKRELVMALNVALTPDAFRNWAARNPEISAAAELVLRRPQLFIFGGDVGTGKTELATTVGDAVARDVSIPVTLFSLSLAARGTGLVGEMTQRIVTAFDEVRTWGEKRKDARGGGLLFIDEADAVAQSRSSTQMHHEDRAGVNALIRGIDDLARSGAPVAVLMATNRLESLDPAVRRRAAMVFSFGRPTHEQRETLFRRIFPEWSTAEIKALADVSPPPDGFTYSDITSRAIPHGVLTAYSDDGRLRQKHVLEALKATTPTPRFGDGEADAR